MRLFSFLLLAFVAVGLRNFEEGLKIDGALYAEISRQIARTGEWFLLQPRIPELNPFYEHPHLGFWTNALVFLVLPAADWSARLSSNLYFFGFLFFFFKLVWTWSASERAACFSILLLCLWWPFTVWFRDVYLDPGVLFWGTLFVYFCEKQKALPAGLTLSLVFLQKGMTGLGFLPLLLFYGVRNFSKRVILLWSLGFFVPLLVYLVAVKNSSVPDFLEHYFSRQFSNRFAHERDISLLWSSEYWWKTVRETWGAPLALFFVAITQFKALRAPLIWFFSFLVLYWPHKRIGEQYSLMLYPMLAFALAWVLDRYVTLKVSVPRIEQATQILCVLILMAVQFFPITLQKRVMAKEILELRERRKTETIERIQIAKTIDGPDFGNAAPFAWYGDVIVEYKP